MPCGDLILSLNAEPYYVENQDAIDPSLDFPEFSELEMSWIQIVKWIEWSVILSKPWSHRIKVELEDLKYLWGVIILMSWIM